METVTHFRPNIEILADPEKLAQRTVEIFLADARKTLSERNAFRVAVSGGQTPKRFFQLLGELPHVAALPWDRIHLFWVDERCVPPNSETSNYRLAAETFLTRVPIPKENVHQIPAEYADSGIAAQTYEQTIRTVFSLSPGELPRFDLIILGLGIDGHTGSLFPNSPALLDKDNLACLVHMPNEKLRRITLTPPVLRAASHLTVLAAGQEKARILKSVLTLEPDEIRYPIHILWPVLCKVTWLIDSEAAKLL